MGKVLPDVKIGALAKDPDAKIESLARQVNEQARLLNSEERLDLADSATINITLSGASTQAVTIPHGLDFTPAIDAYLNQVSMTVGGKTISTTGNIPLPTYIQATVNTTDDIVEIKSYLFVACDEVNVYFIILNATGITGPLPVRYHLYKEVAGSTDV